MPTTRRRSLGLTRSINGSSKKSVRATLMTRPCLLRLPQLLAVAPQVVSHRAGGRVWKPFLFTHCVAAWTAGKAAQRQDDKKKLASTGEGDGVAGASSMEADEEAGGVHLKSSLDEEGTRMPCSLYVCPLVCQAPAEEQCCAHHLRCTTDAEQRKAPWMSVEWLQKKAKRSGPAMAQFIKVWLSVGNALVEAKRFVLDNNLPSPFKVLGFLAKKHCIGGPRLAARSCSQVLCLVRAWASLGLECNGASTARSVPCRSLTTQ